MTLQNEVRVKLNERGWEIYKQRNGFWESNVDENGYSTFSYDYFEELFLPSPFDEFSLDVIMKNTGGIIND